MGIILANIEPISVDNQGIVPPMWGPFQSIEDHPYKSLPGAVYLAPAHRTFSLVGVLPPGLSVASGDGVVSGTVGICTSDGLIIDAIDAYPDGSVSLSSYITESCSVTPGSYTLGDEAEIIYSFPAVTIMGIWDMPTPGGPVPVPVTKNFEIKILKNFAADVSAYEAQPE